MPIQTYRCIYHGYFEVSVPFTEQVPLHQICPAPGGPPPGSRSQARRLLAQGRVCGAVSAWQPPTGVAFKIK